MIETFALVLSKPVSVDEVRLALSANIPPERLQIEADSERLGFEASVFAASVETTADPHWPCTVCVWVCPLDLGLGEYPDLRVAIELCRRLACDALCGNQPFLTGLDPHDPYYSIAYIDGSWFLASTAGTRLMGPYSNGKEKFAGDASVRLLHRLEIPADTLRLSLHYSSKKI